MVYNAGPLLFHFLFMTFPITGFVSLKIEKDVQKFVIFERTIDEILVRRV